jgi:hypothetical protein
MESDQTPHSLAGGCHCGAVRFALTLTRPPASYQPRACDCEFCTKHGAAYVSDPAGTLELHVSDPRLLARYRQGSGTAQMLLCRQCGVLVGALYEQPDDCYGVVNAQALEGVSFGARHTVSPRTLSAPDKERRWRELWFPNVRLRS